MACITAIRILAARQFVRPLRRICTTSPLFSTTVELSELEFERQAEVTLARLYDFFDSLPDQVDCDPDYDVTYSMGVLTAHIAPHIGTYVINKQAPNRQLWLSSPLSGPKRYDYDPSADNRWTYKHDDISLNSALQEELKKIYSNDNITVPI